MGIEKTLQTQRTQPQKVSLSSAATEAGLFRVSMITYATRAVRLFGSIERQSQADVRGESGD